VELILQVAGGELVGDGDGSVISAGLEIEPLPMLDLRLARLEHVLGVPVSAEAATGVLKAVGFDVHHRADGVLRVTIPANRRHEVTREIDVIEEVARLHGLDKLEVSSSLSVRLDLKHPTEWRAREQAAASIGRTLTAAGFFETVTFSFLPAKEAVPFLSPSLQLLKVDEERRKGAPFLRPSIVPSLLTVRKANQDARVEVPGGARLYEIASVFAEPSGSTDRRTIERRNLTLLMDVEAPAKHAQRQNAWRGVRSVLDSVAAGLGGASVDLAYEPIEKPEHVFPAFTGEHVAGVSLDDERIGYAALLSSGAVKQWGLDLPVVVAEVSFASLMSLWPPKTGAIALPEFPGIRRDVSLVVDESVPYASIESVVLGCELDKFEDLDFVTTFRGPSVGDGKKSVTLRLGFRDPDRTLRHEEVDAQMAVAVAALQSEVGAEVRS